MAVTPGTRVGPYEIVDAIGAGGMGEVYRATDSNLKRSVAIKVLPASVAGDADRLARFQREAEVLAALNHPHIAQIYGLEKSAGLTALVMELVEGDDLSQRIARGAMPIDEALPIAKQIAEALEAAHEAGIIHRDLKPANIKVRADGTVKVLDFGLAKAMDPPGAPGADAMNSPTMTARATQMGMILGTAAYMAPEQARGKAVDKRTDIWAFGVVVYEMLTGRRLFPGDEVSDTLAAVLRQDIDWQVLPASTPPALAALLRRCLDRDSKQRLRDIGEARVLLSGAVQPETSVSSAPGAPAPSRPYRSAWELLAGALALMAVASTVTWWFVRRGPTASAELPIEPDIRAVTADSGLTTDPAASPNGSLLAYASDRGSAVLNIWVQPLPGGQPVQVTRDEAGARSPNFSPDGSRLVYRSERNGGGLYVVPALGGPERLIAPRGRAPRFSPDGRRIAYVVGGRGALLELWMYGEDSMASAKVATTIRIWSEPVWSPDGAALCVFGAPHATDGTASPETFDWYRVEVSTGAASRMGARGLLNAAGVELSSGIDVWLPAEMIFTHRSGDSTGLWSVGVSADGKTITGPVRRLTGGSGVDASPTVAAGSFGRQLYFTSLDRRVNLYRLPIAANEGRATGDIQALTETASTDDWPSLSRDGRALVFASGPRWSRDAWLMDLDTRVATPLGTGGSQPSISPDGQRVVYRTTIQGKTTNKIRPVAGGAAQPIEADLGAYIWDWPWPSLLITGGAGKDRSKLSAFDVATGKSRRLLTGDTSDGFYGHGRLSPDGRWMSAMEWTSQERSRVIVFPFGDAPAPPSQWIVVSDDDSVAEESAWSPDGQVLYFVSERDGSRCIWARRLDPRTKQPIGPPAAVLHLHGSRRSMVSTVDSPARMAIGPREMIFAVELQRGNIWRATLRELRR